MTTCGMPALLLHPEAATSYRGSAMKWAGMYLVGFAVLVGGLLAALWKLGVLQRIGVAWTLIGVAIVIGFGIMISVANSGRKENIEIDRK
jgi:hypothetical protein